MHNPRVTRRTIMFDEDGVCFKSEQVAIDTINDLFGTNYTIADIPHYSWFIDKVRTLKRGNITFENARNLLFNDKFISRALPTPGSQQFVTRLHELNYKIAKATSRPSSRRVVTEESNSKYFPEVDYIYMKKPGQDKLDAKLLAIELRVPLLFIDDDAALLYDLLSFVAEDTFFAVIDRPWNQVVRDASGKEVYISRDGERLRRFGYWEKDDYEWDQIFKWIAELSAQQAEKYP